MDTPDDAAKPSRRARCCCVATRGEVTDILSSRVYKALAAAGLEIPYSKHDVYIKQMPGR
jgi:hypothetical protein